MRPTRPHIGLLAALAWVTVLSGCAETPGPDRLVAALETSGVPTAQATCVVDAVEDVLDADDIEALVERGTSGAPRDDPKVPDEKADRLRDAMAACRELGVVTTTGATVPIDESTTTPTVRGEVPTTTPATADGDGSAFDTTAPEG